jgi:exodeoxyribonuclease V gamma subunit
LPLVVHRSHRAEDLAAELATVLAPAPDDPFMPDVVAVHSAGLEEWLSMEIARHNGICANVLFPRPNEVLAELAADALGEELSGGWTAQRILWAMLASVDQAGPEVEKYLLEDGPEEKTRRAVALFQSLARIFEAYGTYRPELVRQWQVPRGGEPWEAPLWRAIEARLGACHLTAWEDRLAGRAATFSNRGRLCFFSVSTLAPIVVRLLEQLSGPTEVHVFFLLASPGGNHPLNASMAMLARDFHSTLRETPNAPPPERTSLLRSLQADLVDDVVRPAEADDSIQVHVCHSPLRQVQVLKDALLAAFDRIPDLQPRDVLVLAPHVETFAPLVEAVFGTERNRLPYTLADRGVRQDNQAADALMQVLELADSRFEAPKVLELLTLEPVRARFGLDAEDMPRVRSLLVESGARWGRDAAHRVEWDLPADDRFTWRFALERLLLGQALADPDHTVALGHAPDCDFEGKDDRRILGGLVDFAETLLAETADLLAPRTAAEWFARLARTADRMLADDPDRPWRKWQVLFVLNELAKDAGTLDTRFDLRTTRAVLQGRFSTREPGRGFLGGAITISELVPLRSIPFRVVCLVGIDEGEFPRIETRPGYDRMASKPERGDRSARSDDRALFLEAILSARDLLLVTCTGKSDRTGRDVPLAVPVVELLDVLAQMGATEVVRTAPLQPWAPELFGESHDAAMAIAADAWREGRTNPAPVPKPFAEPLPEEPFDQMTLAELTRFWRHPPSELVRTRLRVSLYEDSDEVLGTLPTSLDGLERWKIGDALLQDRTSGVRFLRGSTVALGTPGRIQVEQAEEAIAIVRALLERHRGDRLDPRDVDIFVDGVRLTGRVGELTTKGRVIGRAGAVRAQHRLEAWITHLALHASGWRGTTTILGTSDCKVLDPVDDAHEHLATLLEWTRHGRNEPLFFWPEVSADALEAFKKNQNEWKAYYESENAWKFRGDSVKAVDRWVLGDRNPFHPDIDEGWPRTVARAVWTPVCKHEHEVTE